MDQVLASRRICRQIMTSTHWAGPFFVEIAVRLIRTTSIVACALALAACARAQKESKEPVSILKAPGDSVHVRMLDAATAKPIANTDVEMFSDNGIRCIKAPCPTDGKHWKGTSDADGRVTIPKSALNTTANIKTATYDGDLVGDATSDSKGGWNIELFAEQCADLCPHAIKLLDARTGEPIANKSALIEIRSGDAHDVASVTSNALGYVLVPFTIVAKGAESSWIVVDGYRDAKLDFAAVRRKLKLEPR